MPVHSSTQITKSPARKNQKLTCTQPCGTVVLKTTVAGAYSADLSPIVIDEVKIIGSRCGPFPKAIAALSAGMVDVIPLIGQVFTLDEAETAFEFASRKGVRKVLMNVSEPSHS